MSKTSRSAGVLLRMSDELRDKVTTVAIREKRSLNNQVLIYLEEATKSVTADPDLIRDTPRPGAGRKKKDATNG